MGPFPKNRRTLAGRKETLPEVFGRFLEISGPSLEDADLRESGLTQVSGRGKTRDGEDNVYEEQLVR